LPEPIGTTKAKEEVKAQIAVAKHEGEDALLKSLIWIEEAAVSVNSRDEPHKLIRVDRGV
jgi:hypothetical protein